MAAETSAPTTLLPGYPELSRRLADTSLILCSRNRPGMLRASIASILEGRMAPSEMVVIDQSDTPDAELDTLAAEAPGCVQYVWSDSRGLSRANNLGISLVRYQWLIFTHDDVLVEKDWLENLIAALTASGERTVVTGRVLSTAPEVDGGFATTLRIEEDAAVYEGRAPLNVLKPLNMAMHRAALENAGRFDEELGPGTRFPGAEDSDLGYRLLNAGYRIAYIPEATLYHRAWRPARGYLRLRWGYGVAQGAFYAKHSSRHDRYMLRKFLVDAGRRARRFARRVIGEPVRALEEPLFIVGNLVGAARWTAMRQRGKRA